MNPDTRKQSNHSSERLRKSRLLRFDILEDRRLMAGLEVFLFNDLDGSRAFGLGADSALADKAVYVDLNRDGQMEASEPWTVTDISGIARFASLDPGSYQVRLVGNNKSVVQSYPTQPADHGVAGESIGKIVRVEADGNIWASLGNTFSLRRSATFAKLQSIEFGTSVVLDAVLASADGAQPNKGYVLTRGVDQSQALWEISTGGSGTKTALDLDVSDAKSLTLVGDRLLVGSGKTLQELTLLGGFGTKTVLKPGVAGIAAGAEIKSLGPNSFAVMERLNGSSRVSVYELTDNVAKLVGKRSFASDISNWGVSGSSGLIAVNTEHDLFVVSIGVGLPTAAILPNAVGPVVFDAGRNILLTGSSSTPNQLVSWNMITWKPSMNIPLSTSGASLGDLVLDSFGKYLVTTGSSGTYQHDLADAVIATVTVSESGTTQIQIGVRYTSANKAPTLSPLGTVTVDEDQVLTIGADRILGKAADENGDSIVYLQRSQVTLGTLAWSQTDGGVYQPSLNKNGSDSVVFQAYDGRDWSAPQALSIQVTPVNDLPVDITSSVDGVAENPIANSALASLMVQDPDSDSDYEFFVDDSRFKVVGGVLKFLAGILNFEKEPKLLIPVVAVNRKQPKDIIGKTLTFSVSDVNDAPTDIVVPSAVSVPELTKGVVLGAVKVVDEDAQEQYVWSVSDSRFEIVDGKLQLAGNTELDYETQSTIGIKLRAVDGSGKFSIEKTLTVSVTDQNDAPVDLVLTGSGAIPEKRAGATFGNVKVIDPDQGEVYAITVNDSRFEVVNGVAKLKSNVSVDWVEPGFIDLTFTATSQRNGTQIQKSGRLNVVRDKTPYHNDVNPLDVDGDGSVTPLDPLTVINYINRVGVGPVVDPGEGEGILPDVDVDGDGVITPLDILILINKLNQSGGATGEGNSNGSGSGGLGGGEGEASPSSLGSPSSQGTSRNSFGDSPASPSANQSPQSSFRATDTMLAGYMADQTEEVGFKKSRRR